MSKPTYKRILLKISGEMLQGSKGFGIDPKYLNYISEEIIAVAQLGVEVAVVIGGGNIFRGSDLAAIGLGQITGDQMGMLATVINGLSLRDALQHQNQATAIFSAFRVEGMVPAFEHGAANDALSSGHVTIFIGGTGNPFFTTDTAASLRAIEIGANLLLKGTKVDGIYSADPNQNENAQRFTQITYDQVISEQLGVMDLNAICLCRDYNLPLRVFNLNESDALKKIVKGGSVGTLVNFGE